MSRTVLRLALACVCAASVAACGSDASPTSPSTTTTAAGTSTEFFTGTLSPGGTTFYSFTVTNSGTVAVTLASTSTSARIGPALSLPLNVGLGTPSGFGCALGSTVVATPALASQLTNGSAAPGVYCVAVSDAGTLSGDVTFTVRITHT